MNIERAFQAIVDGNAILFCGAGFSIGVNSESGALPTGARLARELFMRATGREAVDGFDNVELSQVADYFEQEKGKSALINFLVARFSVSIVPSDQQQIGKQPWHRIYTTNYDDCLESITDRSMRLHGITAAVPLGQYRNSPNLVVHINGYVRDKQSPFILSNTDYATQTFVDSPWWHVFRQDIAEAEAVFFMGYSLYDLDIARALVSSDTLKAKIFFCNGNNPDPITAAKFNAFGQLVANHGIAEIAKQLQALKATTAPVKALKIIQKIGLPSVRERISDREISDFLLWGICPDEGLWHALESKNSRPSVTRTAVSKAIHHIEEMHDVAFLGGVASGKSIAARQLALQLRALGIEVFLVVGGDHKFLREDLVHVVKSFPECVVIFDGAIRYHEDMEWYLSNRKDKQQIVCVENTFRWLGDERIRRTIDDGLYRNIAALSLEDLDETEMASFVELFNSTGMWADQASLSLEAKRRKLSKDYEGKIRSVLLSFVRSQFVRDIVTKEIKEVCTSSDHKKLLATAFLLSSLDVLPSETELEDLSDLSAKSISLVLREKRISWLVTATNSGIASKSLCVGHFFLSDFCTHQEILDWLLHLNKASATLYNLSYTMQELYKQLGRFQPIQRLLPQAEDTSQGYMEKYFDSIKDFGRRSTDPLFWMHYSMVFTFSRNWERAKQCIETSCSLARKKGFDPFQIDTQYARFLLEGIIDLNPAAEIAIQAFMESKRIIDHMIGTSNNRHYPFRVAELYGVFYLQYKSRLTEAQRKVVISSMNRTVECIADLPKDLATHYDVVHCRKALNDVLAGIAV